MKRIITCLLLLMCSLGAAVEESNLPLFTIDKLTIENYDKVKNPMSFTNREVGRVVIAQFSSGTKYLMRVDPIEYCSHYIICTVLNTGEEGKQCKDIAKKLIVYPHLSIISNANDIVHIGTIGNSKEKDTGATIFAHNGDAYETIDIRPFPLGKAGGDSRTHFGPLFRKFPGGADADDCKKKENVALYTNDTSAQCPFTHEWMGFARWPPVKDKEVYNKNFWKSPIYHYTLQKGTGKSCGQHIMDENDKVNDAHTSRQPYQIDIEIDDVFIPNLVVENSRCFGFALVFGEELTTDAKITLSPDRTFEFYPASMMFLAPDSDKIRALRVSRAALRKIRISFFKKDEKNHSDKRYTQNFAIVEYAFLNDNIAGVREYIPLTKDDFDKYKTVTLFQEGFCNVRVLNVNHPGERCWSIAGCEVMKRRN
ncbi:hypothetical protein PRIPAC_73863 [Pristionchus pacificus]|uniref:Uncharacterized protein n=1 Tax=Pristionchus pacificus TaxID=54126 RepID=A0A2A6CF49_PRIPA|nr:hypothetical protein PRIPAC_73863 [Pristionchus pacificus]|eukprot:PDM76822.1 hypothetical protein PRIPAC_42217 [Pristionchus pacificus]